MISCLKPSSPAVISVRERELIVPANSISLFQTSPMAWSCSWPGSVSTDSTSWLAMAAVMHS